MENRKSCKQVVRIAAATLCSFVLLPHVCRAAPTIGKIVPAGATQGSEVEVLVFGTNLHDPQALFLKTELFSRQRSNP